MSDQCRFLSLQVTVYQALSLRVAPPTAYRLLVLPPQVCRRTSYLLTSLNRSIANVLMSGSEAGSPVIQPLTWEAAGMGVYYD